MPAILQVQQLTKRFGPRVIIDDASVTLTTDQKTGFIGRNGAGQSTLCKILIGQDTADEGEIVRSSDLRVSYLEQHDPFEPGETVVDFLTRHTEQPAWRCGEVAARFQLTQTHLGSVVAQLSGGYQTRVKLTSMLLREPNFLILDEPSNYLDLKTLILLEEFLEDFDGGFLIVSHDREFLKKTCDHTLEAEDGRLTLYPSTVEEYLVFKQEQEAQAVSRRQTIESKRRQLQAFVDRFHAKASKASQARAKMKQIQRLETIELAGPQSAVRIKIPPVAARHGTALRCEDLRIGYPGKLVASGIRMHIDHGAHVAVLGDNGQGKTTLLRTLAGNLPPQGGEVRWGFHCDVAYYAQHVVSALDPSHDVFTHLERQAAASVTRQELLAMAGSFLFKGDDVRKPVSVLSGGECARLCLAGLLLMKRSVLLLDEPTNHLDFDTVESLGAALRRHHGTVFFISHDRTFVNLVATEIVEVKDGAVVRYPGSYADYVYHLELQVRKALTADRPQRRGEATAERRGAAEVGRQSGTSRRAADTGPAAYQRRKQQEAARRKLTGQLAQSEQLQTAYRTEKHTLEAALIASPDAWTPALGARFDELTRLLEQEEHHWLELTKQLEELPSD